ncbi:major facilitator superfamily domain-containing protein [Pseudomassariella vexata]|uniref:Major facilitator superfamily domain-containing protein n=1 Tax=Pseudomassariella vexata TaxID=1141098 RepID=A0A1Y2DNX2_9PEZI|nr:major facilitator superfamily domain-containing protein [Pseudomassariella vexata]ORY60869.1 major facilitator superfamily domain-containing protein [Pseudomassariella vexata]
MDSGISGGANSDVMLIAGRAVQGIRGSEINLIIKLIISDLIPFQERGSCIAKIFTIFYLGTTIGPFVGGEQSNWRLVFYINLPSGAPLYSSSSSFSSYTIPPISFTSRLNVIDYLGNAILIAAVPSVLTDLARVGTRYPRRTPVVALIMAFLSFILLYWGLYFLLVYFQAVLHADNATSGIWLFANVLVKESFHVVGSIIVTKRYRYRPLQFLVFALMILGFGIVASSAAGIDFMMLTNLAAVQADLPEKDVAIAAATLTSMHAYGVIWGVLFAEGNLAGQHRGYSGILLYFHGEGNRAASKSGDGENLPALLGKDVIMENIECRLPVRVE